MPGSSLRQTRIAPASPAAIEDAAAILRAGGLVGMPTETVYGLAGLATSDAAVAAIYAAKVRPAFNPLIAHFADAGSASAEAVLDERARRLAAAFWPGPLTIVAPVSATCRVGLLARSGLDTLALRVPAHPVAAALIRAVGAPLAAPSANRSGRVSPTRADHVAEDLDGRIDLILDAGPCPFGVESTIVACLGGPARLLRPGAIAAEDLERALGEKLEGAVAGGQAPIAPGALASHYAPNALVRLDAEDSQADEAALDFAGRLKDSQALARLDLSPDGDLREAAAHLFAYLRSLDARGTRTIAVAPIPYRGLGAAINDRLRRAASPRPDDTRQLPLTPSRVPY